MKPSTIKYAHVIFIAILAAIISGCAGTAAAVGGRDLKVNSQMSSTVFLQPAAPNQKIVLVQVKNTSGQAGMDSLQQVIAADLEQQGYKITTNPNDAHYIVQANVLQAGENKPNAAKNLLAGGFGGAALGAGVGALTGGDIDSKNTVAGALIGAAVGAGINAAFKEVTYTITTDVQLSVRTQGTNQETATSNLKQGDSSVTTISGRQLTDWQRYQTRVVTSAEKVNLKFSEAQSAMVDSAAQAIAGML